MNPDERVAGGLMFWWRLRAGRQRQASGNDRTVSRFMLHFVAVWFLIGAAATIIERTLST